MSRKRHRKRHKKIPVDWIEVLVQFLTGIFTGIILMIIDKYII